MTSGIFHLNIACSAVVDLLLIVTPIVGLSDFFYGLMCATLFPF